MSGRGSSQTTVTSEQGTTTKSMPQLSPHEEGATAESPPKSSQEIIPDPEDPESLLTQEGDAGGDGATKEGGAAGVQQEATSILATQGGAIGGARPKQNPST